MTNEEFYGEALDRLQQTESLLLEIIEAYTEAAGKRDRLKPVVYSCSRIKTPESALHKCEAQGLRADVEGALENLYDLVGIRAVCAFSADVYQLAGWLKQHPQIRVEHEKDYYSCPKPNGYRSYHLQIHVLPTKTSAEIQLRTIATDFWATLEHQMKYKKDIPNEKMIRGELKRCADEIASVDLSMQTIREIIQESLSSTEKPCDKK